MGGQYVELTPEQAEAVHRLWDRFYAIPFEVRELNRLSILNAEAFLTAHPEYDREEQGKA